MEKGDDTGDGGESAGRALVPVRGKGGAPLLFDAGRRAVFLEALRGSCHLGKSARAAGVASVTVYSHRMRDVDFDAAVVDALAEGARRLQQGMLDRAIDEAAVLDAEEEPDAAGVWAVPEAGTAPENPAAQGGGERPRRWLAARLGSVTAPRAAGARKTRRGLPRAEVDRLLLDALERLARGLGR